MIHVKTVSLAVGTIVGALTGMLQAGGTEELGTLLEHGLTGGAASAVICFLLLKGRMDVSEAKHVALKDIVDDIQKDSKWQTRALGEISHNVAILMGAQSERRAGVLHTREDDVSPHSHER